MKRPAEKLYRIKVTLTWFERHAPNRNAMKDLASRGARAVTSGDQHHITGVDVKRRFRV